MPKPLGQFSLTDPFTTALGWKLAPGQTSVGAVVYVNNQSPQEFAVWGNGVDYLGTAPAWIAFWKFHMPLVYTFVEFRPTMNLNPLSPPSLYVNGLVFEAYESDPLWQPIAVVRQTDVARQARSVAVPVGLSHFSNGFWQAGDPDPIVFMTANASAAQLAASVPRMPIYLYYAHIVPATTVAGAAMSFQLEFQWRTAGGAAVGTPFVMANGLVGNTSADVFRSWIFAPVWPYAAIGPMPATAVKADLQMTQLGGTRINLLYSVAFWADVTNLIGDADIGNQTPYNQAFPDINPYF